MHFAMRCTSVGNGIKFHFKYVYGVVKREGREKIKERMKRQRRNGQSGIGDDFRQWRSDTEMVMRQQYQ